MIEVTRKLFVGQDVIVVTDEVTPSAHRAVIERFVVQNHALVVWLRFFDGSLACSSPDWVLDAAGPEG